jgi:hypothetical protein
MRDYFVAGYALSAFLYFLAWLNPSLGVVEGLVDWVSFTRLPLTEFLTLHAATLLGAVVFASASSPDDPTFKTIFYSIAGFYVLMGAGAFLFHRSHKALVGFYVLILVRFGEILSLGGAEVNVMRSTVVKNLMMSVPMMLLVAAIAMSDDGLRPWQEDFRMATTLTRRVWRGKPLLITSAYYLLWAYVEAKWPESMTG